MKYLITVLFFLNFYIQSYCQMKKSNTTNNTSSNIKRDQNNAGRDVKVTNKTSIDKRKVKVDNRKINVGGDAFFDSSKQINILNKPEARHLTQADIQRLIKEIPSKTIALVISIYNNDMESKRFADEVDEYLTKAGYNVELRGNIEDTYEFYKDKRFTIKPFYSDHSKHEIIIIPQD